jgi:hypothetical protein
MVSDRPANSTAKQVQEKGILPTLRAVTHRRVKNSSRAMLPHPRHWIGATLIAHTVHASGLEERDFEASLRGDYLMGELKRGNT